MLRFFIFVLCFSMLIIGASSLQEKCITKCTIEYFNDQHVCCQQNLSREKEERCLNKAIDDFYICKGKCK